MREVWEELRLHVRPIAVLGSFGGPSFRITYTNGDVVSYVIAAYECRRLGGTLRPDGEEIFEARYCAASQLASILLAPWAVEILPTLMRRRAGVGAAGHVASARRQVTRQAEAALAGFTSARASRRTWRCSISSSTTDSGKAPAASASRRRVKKKRSCAGSGCGLS